MSTKFLLEKVEGTDRLEDVDVIVRVMLERILDK
jgi:hypothetical protein